MVAMVRQIKKYPNRRLYDTGASCYISNEDVRELVCSGEQVSIIDSKSGVDITRSVLLSIIAEEELAERTPVFTQAMLAEVIRYQDDYLVGVLGIYLERCLQLFLQNQALFRAQMQDFDGDNPIETITRLMDCQADILRQSKRDTLH